MKINSNQFCRLICTKIWRPAQTNPRTTRVHHCRPPRPHSSSCSSTCSSSCLVLFCNDQSGRESGKLQHTHRSMSKQSARQRNYARDSRVSSRAKSVTPFVKLTPAGWHQRTPQRCRQPTAVHNTYARGNFPSKRCSCLIVHSQLWP